MPCKRYGFRVNARSPRSPPSLAPTPPSPLAPPVSLAPPPRHRAIPADSRHPCIHARAL